MTIKNKDSHKVHIPGITRQDGELAIIFVEFLEYFEHESQTPNIYLSLAAYSASHRFPTSKVDALYNLVHMYVHKILRHKPRALKNELENQ